MKQKTLKIKQSTLFFYKSTRAVNSTSANKETDTTTTITTTITSTGFYK